VFFSPSTETLGVQYPPGGGGVGTRLFQRFRGLGNALFFLGLVSEILSAFAEVGDRMDGS
jgi:hypothetical protein